MSQPGISCGRGAVESVFALPGDHLHSASSQVLLSKFYRVGGALRSQAAVGVGMCASVAYSGIQLPAGLDAWYNTDYLYTTSFRIILVIMEMLYSRNA